jgi:hypothetical protein
MSHAGNGQMKFGLLFESATRMGTELPGSLTSVFSSSLLRPFQRYRAMLDSQLPEAERPSHITSSRSKIPSIFVFRDHACINLSRPRSCHGPSL